MRISFLGLFLGTLASTAINATTFDAVTAFSSSNPSVPWTYGSGTAGTSNFTAFSVYTGNSCFGVTGVACWQPPNPTPLGPPYVALNQTAVPVNYGTVVVPNSVLWLHPGPSTDTIVEWTAPAAGTYNISGFFELLDVTPSGVVGSVYQGSTQLYSGILTGPGATHPSTVGGEETFNLQATLNAGDVLQFAVNNDGNYLNDSTGFDVIVATATTAPEPRTVPMLSAGIIILLVASKKRRMA